MRARAICVYLFTIVAPAAVLVWLGVQSFERQGAALASLTAEKVAAEVETRLKTAAEQAMGEKTHPIAKHFFKIERGVVVQPALRQLPPLPTPSEFSEAEHQEFGLNRADLALQTYRKLFESHQHESLALSRIARCFAKMGRLEEARATWKVLAEKYADERDLSHRPYGIVGAIEADGTAGLYEKIESGRWELTADQAEYFLTRLDPERASPYLDQFRFARELEQAFTPSAALRPQELYSYAFGAHRILYKGDGGDLIVGFSVDADWVNHTLRPSVERDLGVADSAKQNQLIYGGAIGLILVVLSAGVVLLLRDVSRESRVNRVRSDFVDSVSHELKTPITLIRLYSETLLRHSELGAEDRADFHRIIMRESDRLGRLVDQILTFSRVERGDHTYQFEEGDVTPVVARVLEDYREYLDRSGFKVNVDLPEAAPMVRFDPSAVSQGLVNLLDNAVKYSDQAREIAVRLVDRGETVAVEVADCGVGIPSSEHEKVFERFYRIPNGGAKGGYGLGLFMVKHIMAAHGGDVELESGPGRGSVFRLVFSVVKNDR